MKAQRRIPIGAGERTAAGVFRCKAPFDASGLHLTADGAELESARLVGNSLALDVFAPGERGEWRASVFYDKFPLRWVDRVYTRLVVEASLAAPAAEGASLTLHWTQSQGLSGATLETQKMLDHNGYENQLLCGDGMMIWRRSCPMLEAPHAALPDPARVAALQASIDELIAREDFGKVHTLGNVSADEWRRLAISPEHRSRAPDKLSWNLGLANPTPAGGELLLAPWRLIEFVLDCPRSTLAWEVLAPLEKQGELAATWKYV